MHYFVAREMPILQVYPKDSQTVLEGSTADFHCRATAGIPPPEIKWSRQNNQPLSHRAHIFSSGLLRIENVTVSDVGAYVCVAENSVGVTSTNVILEVQTLPKITISPHNGILIVKSNQHLQLVCSATGHPEPTVSWNKDYTEQPIM